MEKKSLNRNWKFYNDIRHTEEITVNLPHDAMLTEKRLPGMKNGAAAGFFPGGRYVYTKQIFGEEKYRDKAIYLEFEGIYMKSTIYLNDEKVGGWIYGYTGFYVELTDKLKIGEENEIRVVADNSQTPNSRWYTGSGIYRDVNLIVGNKRHIPLDGVKVTTLSVNPAVIRVAAQLPAAMQPDDRKAQESKVLMYPDLAVEVYELHEDGTETLAAEGKGADCKIVVPDAKLWDADHPNRYRIHVKLLEGEVVLDEQTVTTGIRTLTWSAQNGIRVNGKEVKLRGGYIHHDNGILGACAFKKAELRKAKILKNAGFNAIRSAHNPVSKAMLEACDKVGLYVMDETFDQWQMHKVDYDYALYFDEEWEKDCRAMILKDRNHPSVILYSIGNEIADTGMKTGPQISKRMADFFHRMDPTRPITNGINPVVSSMGGAMNSGKSTKDDVVDPYEEKENAQATASLLANMIATAAPFISKWMGKPKKVEKLLKPCFDELDIVGYNYADRCYEPHHEWNPHRIMVGTETYPQSLAARWPLVEKHPYIVGDFMWTAVDYLGEAGIGVPIYGTTRGGFNRPYPCVSGGCGVINLIGEMETEAYQAAIAWGQYKKPYIAARPVNHSGEKYFFGSWRGTDAVGSWSFMGMRGRKAEIEVYSPGQHVELFQDGVSLGKKPLTDCAAKFETTYQPGELRAVAYASDGKVLGEEVLRSAGTDTCLTVVPEETVLKADGDDMTFVSIALTDKEGITKLLIDRKVTVKVSGAGVLAGIGSANPVTEESFTGASYTTWLGRMGCFIRSNGEAGTARVEVSAEGVEPKTIELMFA